VPVNARISSLATPGACLDFEAPDPPLQPGEVLVFMTPTTTAAGHRFHTGDTLTLIKRTNEAPFNVRCSLGNWRVKTKYNVETDEGVWSNIDLAFSEGRLRRQPAPPPRTRWERLREEHGPDR